MSPYSPSLANATSNSLSHSSSTYHPTSLTRTPPPLPPGYSPTANHSLYPSQAQETSTHSPDLQASQTLSATSPPDYHPTWIPRAPTPPRYSPTSPTYSTFAPVEYTPCPPSHTHSSPSESTPPPIYRPSWIPRRNQTRLEYCPQSPINNTLLSREEYVPIQPSPEALAYSPTSPPPYHPTNIASVSPALDSDSDSDIEIYSPKNASPQFVLSSSSSLCSSDSEESSLTYTPHQPHYRPTSPFIQMSPTYSLNSSSIQTYHSYVPSELYSPAGIADSPVTNPNLTPSYSPGSSIDATTSLPYFPTCVSYTPITTSSNSDYVSSDFSLPISMSPSQYSVSSASYSPSSPGYS